MNREKYLEMPVDKIYWACSDHEILIETMIISVAENNFAANYEYNGDLYTININTKEAKKLNTKYERVAGQPIPLSSKIYLIPVEINYRKNQFTSFPVWGSYNKDIEFIYFDTDKNRAIGKYIKTNTKLMRRIVDGREF